MKRDVIWLVAPVAPRCFPSRQQWVTYLVDAQASRKDERRPFLGGKYRVTFTFCADCSAQHSLAMSREGRCDFPRYVADLKAKEEAHAA